MIKIGHKYLSVVLFSLSVLSVYAEDPAYHYGRFA